MVIATGEVVERRALRAHRCSQFKRQCARSAREISEGVEGSGETEGTFTLISDVAATVSRPGTELMAALGFSQQGFLAVVVGLAAAVVLAILIIVLNLPKILIIVLSALGGASTIVAGILLLLGRIPLASFGYGTVAATILNSWLSWLWLTVWLLLAVAGIVAQWRSTQDYTLEWPQTT